MYGNQLLIQIFWAELVHVTNKYKERTNRVDDRFLIRSH